MPQLGAPRSAGSWRPRVSVLGHAMQRALPWCRSVHRCLLFPVVAPAGQPTPVQSCRHAGNPVWLCVAPWCVLCWGWTLPEPPLPWPQILLISDCAHLLFCARRAGREAGRGLPSQPLPCSLPFSWKEATSSQKSGESGLPTLGRARPGECPLGRVHGWRSSFSPCPCLQPSRWSGGWTQDPRAGPGVAQGLHVPVPGLPVRKGPSLPSRPCAQRADSCCVHTSLSWAQGRASLHPLRNGVLSPTAGLLWFCPYTPSSPAPGLGLGRGSQLEPAGSPGPKGHCTPRAVFLGTRQPC